jgi:putative transposase
LQPRIAVEFKSRYMNTYTQILYQIVFTPKNREPVLVKENRPVLYNYIGGIIKNKNCHLYRIGGLSDHIHIVTHLHPSIPLASLVKDIKVASSLFIKNNHLFPLFKGWQDGYAAFTYSIKDKKWLIEYVKNQEGHHKSKFYDDELIELLKENGVEYNEDYLY